MANKKKLSSNTFTKLVLSGGSNKGFAYIGLIKCLEEIGALKHINHICGTSIGSLFALFIILGYNSDELKNIFLHFNYDMMKDMKLLNFIDRFGLDSGEKLEKLIKIFIKNKGFDENITLEQLYQLKKKNMICTSCNLNTRKTVFFDRHNYPNIPCALAVRASMSIPFIVVPVKYHDCLYIDGALTCNVPIEYFIRRIEKIDDALDENLVSKEQKYADILVVSLKIIVSDNFSCTINTLETFIYNVVKTSLVTSEHVINKQIYDNKIQNINFDVQTNNTLDFKLTKENTQLFIDTGYIATKNFFDKYNSKYHIKQK